ncbi:hypothetical protein EDD15DRAFT_2200448 [Pisolithus albus]|nr:hypothetical protein EDD15DRAFT_2200448 [Pisolithus albus]
MRGWDWVGMVQASMSVTLILIQIWIVPSTTDQADETERFLAVLIRFRDRSGGESCLAGPIKYRSTFLDESGPVDGKLRWLYLPQFDDFVVASKFNLKSSGRQSRSTETHENGGVPRSQDESPNHLTIHVRKLRWNLPVYRGPYGIAHPSEDAWIGRGAVIRKRSQNGQSNRCNSDAAVINVVFQPSKKKGKFDYPNKNLEALLVAVRICDCPEELLSCSTPIRRTMGYISFIVGGLSWKIVRPKHGAGDEGLLRGPQPGSVAGHKIGGKDRKKPGRNDINRKFRGNWKVIEESYSAPNTAPFVSHCTLDEKKKLRELTLSGLPDYLPCGNTFFQPISTNATKMQVTRPVGCPHATSASMLLPGLLQVARVTSSGCTYHQTSIAPALTCFLSAHGCQARWVAESRAV